jgi:uroporphyrin-III C-methyltransferase
MNTSPLAMYKPTRKPLHPTKGSVTLVGAGPGDPELLTLKAVKAIASASVILVDDLVNDAVLTHAQADARIVYVGKRGGCQSTPQAFIERLMIAEYKNGEAVVRLKGGDPMIFGRAGEELAALKAAGITCTVVNGITSGLAAATHFGIPLTHRDYAHGAVFVTGHSAPGGAPIDWSALGNMARELKLTLVIYMGVSQAGLIQKGLAEHCPSDTPVALVQSVSQLDERFCTATLGTLAQTIADAQLKSPLIMVIGDVAKLANTALLDVVSSVQDGYNMRLVA